MKIVMVLALVAFAVLTLVLGSNDDAMAKCQLIHSYDTCFQLLNR